MRTLSVTGRSVVSRAIAAGFGLVMLAAPAFAAQCGGAYPNFLAQMQRDAQAAVAQDRLKRASREARDRFERVPQDVQ